MLNCSDVFAGRQVREESVVSRLGTSIFDPCPGSRSERRSGFLRTGPWPLRLLALLLLLAGALCCTPADAAPVPVRYHEGTVRGFLILSQTDGSRIASGDFLQSAKGGEVKTRILLNFKDGSVHDEWAVFSQQRNFLMKSYHLLQKGPAFQEDVEASLERQTGKYRVKVKQRKDGREKALSGKLDLPSDVYNGMVPIVAKNLKGGRGMIHMVAFTPTPRVIELEMIPSGGEGFTIGDLKKDALHYVLKPKLGLLKIPATLMGKMPPDNHLWIETSDVPAFVKFQGPLANEGPAWRIELTSPVWPK